MIALAWALLFLGAAAFSWFNLREARADAEALRVTKRNGPFSRVARGAIREEAVRLGVFTLYSVIGFLALFGFDGLGSVYGMVLLAGGAGMFFNSVQSFRTRRAVLEYGDSSNARTNSQQPPSNRKAGRLVGSTGRSRLGAGPKRQNRNAVKSARRGGR